MSSSTETALRRPEHDRRGRLEPIVAIKRNATTALETLEAYPARYRPIAELAGLAADSDGGPIPATTVRDALVAAGRITPRKKISG